MWARNVSDHVKDGSKETKERLEFKSLTLASLSSVFSRGTLNAPLITGVVTEENCIATLAGNVLEMD